MKAKLISFGQIEIEGQQYNHDVVIEKGVVSKRKKKPSKIYREDYGHTPLSSLEKLPLRGDILYIGTGSYGNLPVMSEVYEKATSKGVKVISKPTKEVCKLLSGLKARKINAVLHVTC